jgi:hypothetical protein
MDSVKLSIYRSVGLLAQLVSSARIALNKRRVSDDVEIRTWERPDVNAGAVCRRFIHNWGGTTIYRDSEYLQWRLFDNPYVNSVVRALYIRDNLHGWVAFTLGSDGMGYIVDLTVVDDDSPFALKDLVRTLLIEAVVSTRNMGAIGVRGWRVNDHPFDKLVYEVSKSIGFFHIKRGHFVVLRNLEAGENRESLTDFDNWYVNRIFTEGVLG